MADHFLVALWARDAVIAGDIEHMREPLAMVASYQYDVAPANWRQPLRQLQIAADVVSSASTIELAARGVAQIGQQCGACHVSETAQPRVPEAGPKAEPVERGALSKRMEQHMWATDQLWEGLTMASEEAWQAGASALASAPLTSQFGATHALTPALQEVRRLGRRATTAISPEQRVTVYAALLATCGKCHAGSRSVAAD